MYYVILTKHDDRLSSFSEVVDGEANQMVFDDVSDYRILILENVDVDLSNDLGDYRYDEELKELVYDPVEETIEYVDLESGETTQMTSADIDALVDEKVKNQVEAVLAEMAANNQIGLIVPSEDGAVTI